MGRVTRVDWQCTIITIIGWLSSDWLWLTVGIDLILGT